MDFNEGSLQFTFDASWNVFKYDDTPDYRKGIGALPETKAVDFIGVQRHVLFFIEIKDFRGHRIENQDRLLKGHLAIEIGQKVRDSIAGLVSAHRAASNQDAFSPYVRPLFNLDDEIRVIVWIEQDLPNYNPKREKARKSVEGNVFKQKLRWFTSRVLVSNVDNNPLQQSGLTVRNLARDT